MNQKLYDVLVWLFRIVVPAIGALYATLAVIWGFPYGEAVSATCAAITVFGNAVLMVDSHNFFNNKVMLDFDGIETEDYTED